MSEATAHHEVGEPNHGWRVVFAGLGINLALGVLYSWSVISAEIAKTDWGWSASERALPYSVACLVFCLIMGSGRPDAGQAQPAYRGNDRRGTGRSRHAGGESVPER